MTFPFETLKSAHALGSADLHLENYPKERTKTCGLGSFRVPGLAARCTGFFAFGLFLFVFFFWLLRLVQPKTKPYPQQLQHKNRQKALSAPRAGSPPSLKAAEQSWPPVRPFYCLEAVHFLPGEEYSANALPCVPRQTGECRCVRLPS